MRTYKRPATILRKAADYIEEFGLYKADEYEGFEDGAEFVWGRPCCVVGAIRLMGGRRSDDPVIAAHDALEASLGVDVDACDWNDTASRRKSQVVRKLREAAESI